MATSPNLEGPEILVVESEALIRMELLAQLCDMGLTTFVASTAAEAIYCLSQHPGIRILLTDITMDGSMDGVRLAHYVRDRWPPVKIVVTSGNVDICLDALPVGSAFFPKPYRPEALWAAMAPMFLDAKSVDHASI